MNQENNSLPDTNPMDQTDNKPEITSASSIPTNLIQETNEIGQMKKKIIFMQNFQKKSKTFLIKSTVRKKKN